jgi:hypothetical protein
MRPTMDAFVRAFEDARQRLIRDEGRNVSVREVIRRAGFDDSQRAGVAYHLNPRKEWPRGHNVPAEVVRRLAAVLPMSEEELMRAAQVAAGYNVFERPWADVSVVVARFFGDKDVSDQEKQEVSARLLQIIADEATRRVSAD